MRRPLFQQPGDYEAFQRMMAQGLRRPDAPLRLSCRAPSARAAGPENQIQPTETELLSR